MALHSLSSLHRVPNFSWDPSHMSGWAQPPGLSGHVLWRRKKGQGAVLCLLCARTHLPTYRSKCWFKNRKNRKTRSQSRLCHSAMGPHANRTVFLNLFPQASNFQDLPWKLRRVLPHLLIPKSGVRATSLKCLLLKNLQWLPLPTA